MSHRIAALTLALSLGALPLASAEAAQGSRRDSQIRQTAETRTIVQVLIYPFLSIFEKAGSHPGNKPGNGTSEAKPEGSGVCPDGGPRPKPGQP
ncbi:MAG TPA: hypothetical protein VLE27_09865 [Thermoanaerobaculia bacterium]|nr:hypothetical protein [Thermoanaerobaculia bacterium]